MKQKGSKNSCDLKWRDSPKELNIKEKEKERNIEWMTRKGKREL